MPLGYIIVQTTTTRAEIPVENVFVTVTVGSSPKNHLVAFRKTNADGKTDLITVNTPSLTLSQYPSFLTPFTPCTIRVEHVSFYTVIIKNVQVFPQTLSLQHVNLIPLQENAPIYARVKEIVIPTHSL